MCKLLIIPRIDKLTQDETAKLVQHVRKKMTERDADGFGYAYLGQKGLYSERFLDTERVRAMLPEMPLASFIEARSDCYGTPSKPIGGLLVHSRTSTNLVSLNATHPFIEAGQAFIHNGVVSNVGEAVSYPSGNDSEMLFQHYLKGGIQRVSESVSGYYACGILDANRKQTVVIKDSTANLYCIYVKKLESFAFGTTAEILGKVANFFKERCRVMKVKNNVCVTFNASGRCISETSFKPIERSFGELDYKSLGTSYLEYKPKEVKREDYELEVSEIYDSWGRPISYPEYTAMSLAEQEECRIYDGHRARMGGES